jgi:hypothetical protein
MSVFEPLSVILKPMVFVISFFACWLIFTITETDKAANEEALRECDDLKNRPYKS